MLPPTQQEIAVAMANHMLNNATPGPANVGCDDGDENMNPILHSQPIPGGSQPQLGKFHDISDHSLIIHSLT